MCVVGRGRGGCGDAGRLTAWEEGIISEEEVGGGQIGAGGEEWYSGS